MDTSRDFSGGAVKQSADNMATQVTDAVSGAARHVSEQVEAGVSGAREYANQATQSFQKAADYVSQMDPKEMANDAYSYMKSHPVHALATAAIIGFVAGRFLAGSSRHD